MTYQQQSDLWAVPDYASLQAAFRPTSPGRSHDNDDGIYVMSTKPGKGNRLVEIWHHPRGLVIVDHIVDPVGIRTPTNLDFVPWDCDRLNQLASLTTLP